MGQIDTAMIQPYAPSTRWTWRVCSNMVAKLCLRRRINAIPKKMRQIESQVADLKVDKGELTLALTGKARAAFAAVEAEGVTLPSVAGGCLLLKFSKVSLERQGGAGCCMAVL